jgi:hypothetical protein
MKPFVRYRPDGCKRVWFFDWLTDVVEWIGELLLGRWL